LKGTAKRSVLPFSASSLALVAGVAVLAVFILYPVFFTLSSSFWSGEPGLAGHYTLSNYAAMLGDKQTYFTVLDTFFQAGSSAAIAISLGTILSIITVRTDTPFRRALFYLPYFPLAFPVLIAN